MFPGQYYEKKQKARKRLKIISLISILISGMAFAGYLFMKKTDTAEVTKEIPVPIISSDHRTTVEIKKLYRCGHIKTEIDVLPENLMNKSAKEITAIMPKWKLISFTKDLLTVEERVDIECGDHFVIKLQADKLQAFKRVEMNNPYMEMQISTATLTNEDINILTTGIDINSEYELLEVFESFSELNQ